MLEPKQHIVTVEAPEAVNTALLSFLAGSPEHPDKPILPRAVHQP